MRSNVSQAAGPVRAAHRAFAGRLHIIKSQPSVSRGQVRRSVAYLEHSVIDPPTARDGGTEHADTLTAERDERTGVRRVRAHSAYELLRRTGEVELAFARLELGSQRHLPGI